MTPAFTASLLAPLQGDFGLTTALRLIAIGAGSGAVGVWVVSFGRAFLAESFTHALLPGLVAASLLGAGLALGALAGIAVAYLALIAISRAPRTAPSSATSVTVTSLVAAGALMATTGEALRFDALLFGDPLAASSAELAIGATAALAAGAALLLLHDRMSVLAFDPGAAASLGVNLARTQAAMLALLVLAVALAANVAGSLTALALVTGPAVAALALVRHSGSAVALAALIGGACGAGGIHLSYYADWPAGASVALLCVAVAVTAPGARQLSKAITSRGSAAPALPDGPATR